MWAGLDGQQKFKGKEKYDDSNEGTCQADAKGKCKKESKKKMRNLDSEDLAQGLIGWVDSVDADGESVRTTLLDSCCGACRDSCCNSCCDSCAVSLVDPGCVSC